MSEEPRIVAREGGLVVVDKPAGLPSTGRTLDDPRSVQAWLQRTLRRDKVWAVHQLDQDTSGLNLFVLQKPLVAEVAARLKDGAKTYVAIVHGKLRASVVNARIGTRRAGGKTFPAVRDDGDDAETAFEPIAANDHASLVLARPRTGRTHQVRLHLAHIGHPVFGERLHRDPPCEEHARQALHAWRMELGSAAFEAPLADDLRALLARLGLPEGLP
jgi:23S rRNA-/tRNA-specific pseudouridylate synthase